MSSKKPKEDTKEIPDSTNCSSLFKKKLGRPKKDKEYVITDPTNCSSMIKRKPGRPKKQEKVVSI